ncbi:MAG: ABC transporter ATP-binding protein [Actinobacteria bacterium]|nr:ABC transporter ATP-binding protein [Actinomycetota bacterium]
MTEPLLQVDDLVVHYPAGRKRVVHAVDGVSLTVAPGEFVALVGESGCGKTTTAQAIMRMAKVTAGTITYRGRDITTFSQRQMRPIRHEMQLIFQDPYESLDPRFRVRDTVIEPLQIHGVTDNREERVRAALERAGLTPAELYIDRYPHELSGGQRQRVSIAASLVLEPTLLLADEPVSMLDVSVRAGILGLLDELRKSGLGILMITHDLSTAAHYADRICVMYLGRVVEEGPAHEVIRNPQHPYTKALVSVVPQPDPDRASKPQILQGETPNPVNIPSGCRFHPRCPVAEARCQNEDPQLRPAGGAGQQAACLLI